MARSAALFVFVFLTLLAPWRLPLSSDGLLVFRAAASLAFEGSFSLPPAGPGARLDPFYFLPAPGGGVVSIYPPLGSILRAPLLLAATALHAGATRGRLLDALLGLIPILFSAATVFPLTRLLRYGGAGRRVAPFLAGALLVATFLGPLGVSDFQEPSLVFLAATSLERALWARRTKAPANSLMLSGFLSGLALLAKPTAFILWPALVVASAGQRPRRGPFRKAAFLAAGWLPGITIFLFLNAARFGNPWETGYSGPASHPLARRVDLSWTLLRLVLLPNRGLLWFAPLLLLGGFTVLAWKRLRSRRVDLIASFLAGGAFLGANLFWFAWEGGMGWGPRLAAPVVVLAAPWLAPRDLASKRTAVALAVFGFVLNLPGYLLDSSRLYAEVASRSFVGRPLGPIVPAHALPDAPGGIHPLQRLHYVPSCASWIVAPGVLGRLLRYGDSSADASGGTTKDAALLRLVLAVPLLPKNPDVGRLLLEESAASVETRPARALRFALLSLDFGGPPVEGSIFASFLLVQAGRFEEAARLCRQGLERDPQRQELRDLLRQAEDAGASRTGR